MSQVVITKILDGARNAVFHVAITGDALGDVADAIIIDPAVDFTPALGAEPSMTIDSLWYDLAGFNAKLEFDYLVSDTPVWSMSGNQGTQIDFCHFGGLKDRSPEMDGLGRLKITTSGLADGDFGTLVVKVRKD